jgi:predicted transcriptional regulator of viral defense system
LKKNSNTGLAEWADNLMAKGKMAFTIEDVRRAFPAFTEANTKLALNRLFKKGKAMSIHKGYYLLITPQYQTRGVLPPPIYLDGLMKYLKRPYYLGLLSAAVFYGAAHQQPQEFFVFTNFPQLRPIKKKGLKVNYISVNTISDKFLESHKTESGYLKISSPELTAVDLINFEKRIGGLSRAATVLNDLAEELKIEKINLEFLNHVSALSLQRLGFILDKILHKTEIATHLYNQCKAAKIKFYRKPVMASGKTKGFNSDNKWKVIINTDIEPD